MMRSAIAILLAALLPAAAPLRGPCDMKTTEKRLWCPTCNAYIPRGDAKFGKCAKDKDKLETHTVCIKPVYIPLCHPDKKGLSPVKCCGVLYDKPTPDVARIVYRCAGCGEQAFVPTGVTHKEDCPDKSVKKQCEKSGTAPHATLR